MRSLSRNVIVPASLQAGAGSGTVTNTAGALTLNDFILGNGAADIKAAGFSVVPIANGGTGQATQAAAYDALSPNTTRGDLEYRGATNTVRLAKGTAGQYLTIGANDPAWAAVPAFTALFGTGGSAGLNPADSTTYYWGGFYNFAPGTADGPPGIEMGVACTLKAVYGRVTVLGTLATGESTTMIVRKNTGAGAGTDILTVSSAVLMSAALNLFSITGQSVACTAGDTVYMKFVTPAWVTNPTVIFLNATLYFEVP